MEYTNYKSPVPLTQSQVQEGKSLIEGMQTQFNKLQLQTQCSYFKCLPGLLYIVPIP